MAIDKDKTFFKIFNSLLKYEVQKGHLKWTISDIARDAKVSRPLVYHYFGKNKKHIMTEAYKYMVNEIFFINNGEKMKIHEVIKLVLERLADMPYVLILFFLENDKDSEAGRIIRAGEKKLFTHLVKTNPKCDESDLLKIYLLELGAIVYKRLTPEQIKQIFKFRAL